MHQLSYNVETALGFNTIDNYVSKIRNKKGITVNETIYALQATIAVGTLFNGGEGQMANVSRSEGLTIGLGLDVDLPFYRGTNAITYKSGGWQKAGLTKIDWGRASIDEYYFKQSFKEAAKNADAIKFNITNFDPAYPDPKITNFEFDFIRTNPALLQKTIFIRNGIRFYWDGTKFIK